MRFVAVVEHLDAAGARARGALGELEDRSPTAGGGVLDAFLVGVPGLVEEELREIRSRLEGAVLGPLERGRFRGLCQRAGNERRVAFGRRVVNRDPARFERAAVCVEGELVGAVDRFLTGEGDRFAARVQHLQGLEPAVDQISRVAGHVAEDVAVRLLGLGPGLAGAADVLADPEVAVGVVLNPLIAAAAECAGDVEDLGRVVRSCRVGRSARVLRRQQQALGPRVPGGAVDRRQRVAEGVLGRQQRDPVRRVGVEVDAADVAGAAGSSSWPWKRKCVP